MTLSAAAWSGVDAVLWSIGAAACLLAAAWLQTRRQRFGTARPALVLALAVTGSWALIGATFGIATVAAQLGESLRNLAWIFAIYRLFALDGRHAAMKPVRPMLAALAFVEFLQMAAVWLLMTRAGTEPIGQGAFLTMVSLRLLVAVGGVVLAHNLFGGASQQARLIIRWPATALAILWVVDLNHYAIAYLSGGMPQVTAALRGLLAFPIAAILALGAGDGSESLRFRPSRAVTFQSVSLLLIGGYLIAMMAAAQWLAFAGSDFSSMLQIVLVALFVLGAVTLAMSRRLRGWLRVTAIKHLFQHRYDYRTEWLRFTRTIGQAGAGGPPLNERVIRALADITDSPAGLLLVPNEAGHFELGARWQWPTAEVPPVAMAARQVRQFEREDYIADLDQVRASGEAEIELPEWLKAEPRAWALVPLLHFERLAGVVVLARPAHVRRLDWEDFDVLRVVGRQLASYLAENAGQEALAEAGRFDEFNRRIAFVMHDIKNLASQLGLLARNAELHADNPEFRADMLVTLRNSTEKLNALVARLSRYGPASVDELLPVRAEAVAKSVVDQLELQHPVTLIRETECEVAANRESLEQVLLHLVQNAIDASPAKSPVFVSVSSVGLNGMIEVVDSGCGMSADFVRTRLFRPFDSTKPGGFGIGAYEARELVRAMRGRLEVESREGLGTRFAVILPMAETAALLETINEAGKSGAKVA
ncbi:MULTISPECIES: XrtA/PEP-CTERM system histidine kinase PrsK [unclassified Novosphingobium]|uniref:XrtA/PEP-CTERM system histidine kinase PrsK n=1 Tax=unclassified Novosphingobium TaxID=2644732 RepID=UPI000EEEE72F|nr:MULTISPECIES: XrtA/PEP-CTERM system histidine kinase PrsK [unclassified Novosphingobium]HCF25386.1 PEP-CTERM system histidine kinase PrsK [Novosphingobium sp.]HQV04141.1 PEP-CTERM system histidine kinase PrsK [Novosphingobium sp.]